MDTTARYASPLGGITIETEGKLLVGLRFSDSLQDAEDSFLPVAPIDDVRRWLDCYFGGSEPPFTPPLLLRGTAFQRRVWHELASIPFGQTVSYGHIARRIGCRSAQAVGQAVGSNPVSIIIPCHRVVGSDGSMTGYAGGIERKIRLLQLERAMLHAATY